MSTKKNNNKQPRTINVLESLRDVGGSITKDVPKKVSKASSAQLKALNEQLIKKAPKDFMDQLFGPKLEMPEVPKDKQLEKEIEKRKKAEKTVVLERTLRQEQEVLVDQRTNELRLELHAIMQEVVTITSQTEELAKEVKIASMQAPNEPGIYHVFFFKNLLDYLISFRKKIENASEWLSAVNGRGRKQNYWSLYKKHGAKFLLSGEHYLTRSAG